MRLWIRYRQPDEGAGLILHRQAEEIWGSLPVSAIGSQLPASRLGLHCAL